VDFYSTLLLKTGVFVWLFVWTIIDLAYPLRLKSFFVNPLDVISGQQKELRGIGKNKFNQKETESKTQINCPAIEIYKLYNDGFDRSCGPEVASPEIQQFFKKERHEKCPIFYNLELYLAHVKSHPKSICSEIKGINDMWNIIRRACIVRSQQVAFFELIIIQIFLVVFWPNTIAPTQPISSTILYLDYLFIIGIIILLAAFVISHIETKPFSIYENKIYRLVLILGSWFVLFLYLLNYYPQGSA